MTGWWNRDPFFVRYMVREMSALAVAGYAIVLMVGVLRLSQGEAAWNGWLAAMKSPLSIALHLAFFVGMVVHAKSWFEIMPKTLPMILKPDGERLGARAITVGGWVATGLASAALLVFALWAGSTP
jgi:fumarate reductase subunit C